MSNADFLTCSLLVKWICPTLNFLLAAYSLNGTSAIFFLTLNFLLAAALCVNRCVFILLIIILNSNLDFPSRLNVVLFLLEGLAEREKSTWAHNC